MASLSTYKVKFQAIPTTTFTKMVIAPSSAFIVRLFFSRLSFHGFDWLSFVQIQDLVSIIN